MQDLITNLEKRDRAETGYWEFIARNTSLVDSPEHLNELRGAPSRVYDYKNNPDPSLGFAYLIGVIGMAGPNFIAANPGYVKETYTNFIIPAALSIAAILFLRKRKKQRMSELEADLIAVETDAETNVATKLERSLLPRRIAA